MIMGMREVGRSVKLSLVTKRSLVRKKLEPKNMVLESRDPWSSIEGEGFWTHLSKSFRQTF